MNDLDFIGTHPRYNDIVGGSLTEFMVGDGKDVTNPNLDLSDFIGLSFATFTDGKLYQLPDQQFANLYWFRYDWFNVRNSRPHSRTSTATSSAFPSTGRRMKISPTTSPIP